MTVAALIVFTTYCEYENKLFIFISLYYFVLLQEKKKGLKVLLSVNLVKKKKLTNVCPLQADMAWKCIIFESPADYVLCTAKILHRVG